jgi:hypothetical protein
MIKFQSATESSLAHWLIEDASIERVEIAQAANRRGASVITFDDLGPVDQHFSEPPSPIAIVLPVGWWRWEQSSDGKSFQTVMDLQSHLTTRGPGLRVNLTLAPVVPFPPCWSRYTKLPPTA